MSAAWSPPSAPAPASTPPVVPGGVPLALVRLAAGLGVAALTDEEYAAATAGVLGTTPGR